MIPGSIVRGAVRAQMEKHAMRGRVKPAIGEKIMGALMPYRGYPWSNDQDRWTQIQHLKNWTGVGIDIIAKLAAQLVPNIAYIRPQRTRNSQKWFTHDYGRMQTLDYGGHSFVSGSYRRKALGVIKPHEEIEPVESDHPLRLLIENPNAWDTQFDHDYELIMFQFLCGVAYDWAVPNELGYPQELWCIPSHWVWPRTGGGTVVDPRNPYADSLIAYYEIIPWGSGSGGHGSFRLPPDQIVRYAFKSPINKVNGYAKTFLGRNWIDADDSIAKSQFAQMSNAALPSFWLEFGEGYEDPDDDAIDRISAKFLARYTGEYKTGVPYIGPAGTVPHVLSFPPTQMAYGEAMTQSADRILALLGVPKAAIGMADGMTFGSVLATLYQFCTFTLGPLLTANGQTKTKFLASRFSTVRDPIRIWNDDPAPPDPDQLNKDLRTDFDLGLITPNEGRAIRGRMPYRYGGDDPLVNGPGGLIPLPINTGQDLSELADLIPLMGRQDNPAAHAEEESFRPDRGSTLNVDEAHSAPRKGYDPNQPRVPEGHEGGGRFAPINQLPGDDNDLVDRLLKADFTDEAFPDLVKEASKTPEATRIGKKLLKKVEDLKAVQQALESHEQVKLPEPELPEEPDEEDAQAHEAWEADVERIQAEHEQAEARAERQYEREHDKLGMREGMVLDRCNELRDELVSEIDVEADEPPPESKVPEKKISVNRIKLLSRLPKPSRNGAHK